MLVFGFVTKLGEFGSHFSMLNWVIGFSGFRGLSGFMVWRFEKMPPRTIGRFCEGFLWP